MAACVTISPVAALELGCLAPPEVGLSVLAPWLKTRPSSAIRHRLGLSQLAPLPTADTPRRCGPRIARPSCPPWAFSPPFQQQCSPTASISRDGIAEPLRRWARVLTHGRASTPDSSHEGCEQSSGLGSGFLPRRAQLPRDHVTRLLMSCGAADHFMGAR